MFNVTCEAISHTAKQTALSPFEPLGDFDNKITIRLREDHFYSNLM